MDDGMTFPRRVDGGLGVGEDHVAISLALYLNPTHPFKTDLHLYLGGSRQATGGAVSGVNGRGRRGPRFVR